jgi:hypothetical protein
MQLNQGRVQNILWKNEKWGHKYPLKAKWKRVSLEIAEILKGFAFKQL